MPGAGKSTANTFVDNCTNMKHVKMDNALFNNRKFRTIGLKLVIQLENYSKLF